MDKLLFERFYELEEKHWWFKGRRKIIRYFLKKFIKNKNRPSILDVGCGTGFNLIDFQDIGEVLGTETATPALEYLEKRGLKEKVFLTDLPNLQVSKIFDCITCLDVLEHVEDDEAALISLGKSLISDGILLVTVPAYQSLWSRHDELAHHVRRYSKKELISKIQKAGFKIEHITFFNTFLFLPEAIFRILKIGKKNDSDIFEMGKFLNFILYAIFYCELFFLKIIRFPFGLSILCVATKKTSNGVDSVQ
ncbi:MAG: class I SAM-dependent methyltransferase [bacterium]|nr:class I SAM-dependent methyltransferase [bacterium]